jgi:1,4-alpha-glucan branching enzyme
MPFELSVDLTTLAILAIVAFIAGSNYGNGGEIFTQDEPHHGQAVSLSLNLPPLGVLILRPEPL